MRPVTIILLFSFAVVAIGTVNSYGGNDGGTSRKSQRPTRTRSVPRSAGVGDDGWWRNKKKNQSRQPLLQGRNNQNRSKPPPKQGNVANCKYKCGGFTGGWRCSRCCKNEGSSGGLCIVERRHNVKGCDCKVIDEK